MSCKVVIPYCIPTSNEWEFLLLCILARSWYCQGIICFCHSNTCIQCLLWTYLTEQMVFYPFLVGNQTILLIWMYAWKEKRKNLVKNYLTIWQFFYKQHNRNDFLHSNKLCTSILRAACFSFKFPSEAHGWFRGVKYSVTTLFFFFSS